MEPTPAEIVTVVCDEKTLEELRKDLQADPKLGKAQLDQPTPEPRQAPPGELRPRQIEMVDVLVAIAIHLPSGLAAHYFYDWLREWRGKKGKNVQVKGGAGC